MSFVFVILQMQLFKNMWPQNYMYTQAWDIKTQFYK